jgi:glycosyltransferase involved in cell wall biosynthesis
MGLLAQLIKCADLRLSVVLFNTGRLEREIRELGVPVSVYPERNWRSSKIFSELVRRWRISQPQIVHTHKYKDTILAVPAARLCGVPVVIRTVHGLSEPFRGVQAVRMKVYELLERVVHGSMVDAIIGVSSQIEQKYRKIGGRPKATCIRNGIELEGRATSIQREAKRQELGLAEDTCAIGAVGRLTPVKGLCYLLQAARLLLDRRVKVHVLLIGDGPLRGDLERLATKLGIRESIAFLGHREDTDELMQALDVFALPSLSEGIPMALLEAMAASRAVVASRVGGIPEVVEDRVSGFLVEVAQPIDLAEKCHHLIVNPEVARQAGYAARKRVEKEFSAASMAERVIGLYKNSVACRVGA